MEAARQQIQSIAQRLRSNAKEPEMAELTADEMREVGLRAREQLMLDSSMLELNGNITIVGDLHSQFNDLCSIFDQNGDPPNTNYLFLGDYVDRDNPHASEVITLLLCYKLLYPESIYLLRGNHETFVINKAYGFYEEMLDRFDVKLWALYQKVFDCLPLCARIGKRIFCMHGGISKDLNVWQQLSFIKRPLEIPDYGILCDLLWSDPDPDVQGYNDSPRGVAYSFGEDVCKEFCTQMGIDLICRAHQVVQDGYEFFANRHLVTIFSAAYYMEEFDNVASVMMVDANLECKFRLRQPVEIEQRLLNRTLKSKLDNNPDERFPAGHIETTSLSQLPPPPTLGKDRNKAEITVSVEQETMKEQLKEEARKNMTREESSADELDLKSKERTN